MPTPLPQISSRAWEHPADRAALNTLRAIPGFDEVVRKVAGFFRRARRPPALPRQRGEGRAAAAPAAGRAAHRRLHDAGLARPPRALRHADAEGQRVRHRLREAVHRRELGRARAARRRRRAPLPARPRARAHHERPHDYRTIALILLAFGIGTLPFPLGVALLPFQLALLEWHRKSELSTDRAGLLAVQDHARRAALLHEARRRPRLRRRRRASRSSCARPRPTRRAATAGTRSSRS